VDQTAPRRSDLILSKDEGEVKKIYVLPHQKPVLEADKRIVATMGGVQSGKTIASLMGLAKVLGKYPGETCFLLAPSPVLRMKPNKKMVF